MYKVCLYFLFSFWSFTMWYLSGVKMLCNLQVVNQKKDTASNKWGVCNPSCLPLVEVRVVFSSFEG